jgi:myo-inositol-1(or 4)-monophosphatase
MTDQILILELLALAKKIGNEASEILSSRPEVFEVSTKSSAFDVVTQMDSMSEAHIVSEILKVRPADGIIGEEGSARLSGSGITWVIDPLDGTVNYLYGLPGWNVSIAAKDNQGVVVGVVIAPTINSTWFASRGGGAFLNDAAISCNQGVNLNRALLGTGFAYDLDSRPPQIADLANLLPQIRDIRRNGAAAVDLCYVAMGALDGYFETGLQEWDLAAGGLIAAEAGAKVLTISGKTIAAETNLYTAIEAALAQR